jgi:hypothetical protein
MIEAVPKWQILEPPQLSWNSFTTWFSIRMRTASIPPIPDYSRTGISFSPATKIPWFGNAAGKQARSVHFSSLIFSK